jgi:hypothetical protein
MVMKDFWKSRSFKRKNKELNFYCKQHLQYCL